MADFLRYKVEGLENIVAALSKYPVELSAEVEAAQEANAMDLQSTAKAMVLRGMRSGRLYKRRSIVHQASAPGEPPKSDKGYLVSRIRGFVENRFTAVLEAATKYAIALELGTRKMGARPFMDRAAIIVLKRAIARLKNAAKKAGQKIAKR